MTNENDMTTVAMDIPGSHAKLVEITTDRTEGVEAVNEWHPVRSYRAITLENGVRCLLVRDAVATEKAALSTTIRPAGQLHDGATWPGRAHLLEHLMFLGSTEFPKENELDTYLTQHGGHSNAYTDLELTCYYMDCTVTALEGALQRWSAALRQPLLLENVVEREIRAVDSEHAKNKPADYWRIYQLSKTLLAQASGPNHPYGHFGSGCLASLLPGETNSRQNEEDEEQVNDDDDDDENVPVVENGDEPVEANDKEEEDPIKKARIAALRQAVFEFWQLHYVASNMTLAVLASMSLDKQEELVRRHFSNLPTFSSSNATSSIPVVPPLSLHTGCRRVDMVPIRPVYSLELHWPMREIATLYDSKPTQVLSHLLGDEGPGSLLHVLRQAHWVQELTSDHGSRSTSAFSVFIVQMELTPTGWQHIDDIIAIVYAYIRLLQPSSSQPLPDHIYKELRTMGDMQFEFLAIPSSAADSVSALSVQMHDFSNPKHYLSGLYKYFSPNLDQDLWNRDFVQQLAPSNMLIVVGAPEYASEQQQPQAMDESSASWKTDPWYGTQYRVMSLHTFPASWSEISPHDNNGTLANLASQLRLPEPNEFLPSDFTLVKLPDNIMQRCNFDAKNNVETPPVCILNTSAVQLWYKPDTAFNMPKVNMFASFPLPAAAATSSVMASLWTEWQNEVNNTFAYAASMAGLHGEWVANPKRNTLELHVSGYSHKAALFGQRVLETTCLAGAAELGNDLWLRLVQKLTDQYQSFLKMAQVYQHAIYYLDQCLEAVPTPVTIEQRLAQLERVTAADLLAFHASQFMSCTGIQVLVHGNQTPQQALEWAQSLPTMLTKHKKQRQLQQQLDPSEQDHPSSTTQKKEELQSLSTTHHTLQQRIVQLPIETQFLFRGKSWNEENANHCTLQYFAFGILDLETSATLSLLRHLIAEPSFNQLRTQEQLGYIVHSQLKTAGDHVKGLVLLVQGEAHDPVHMNDRMQAFWKQVRQQLAEEMTAEEFQSHRQALYDNFMERKKNLLEESGAHWTVITNQSYHFSRIRDIAKFLLSRTKEHVLCMIDKCILHGSSITIHMFGSDFPIVPVNNGDNDQAIFQMISDPIEFGRSQSLYPLPPTVAVNVVDLSS